MIRSGQRVGALLSLSLHAAAGAALLSYEPARSALLAVAPIMVSLIAPPSLSLERKPEPPHKVEVPPKARPVAVVRPAPPEPQMVATAPAEAPTPTVVAPPEPPAAAPILAIAPAPSPVPQFTPPMALVGSLDNPQPEYPLLSRRLGEQGTVILRVLVNPSGTADEVLVQRSSSYARLDQAALEAVKRWKFIPAKLGEQRVAGWARVRINLGLED